jgi:hypothetical protein
MEEILLRDSSMYPSKEVLETALGEDNYKVFNTFIEIITDSDLGLTPDWKYYDDGKSWLCKVCYKKKTVFWLSVWKMHFKLGFYFTEKNCSGVTELNIDKSIRKEFSQSKNIGKLIPLVIKMERIEQIEDVIKIIEYKKSLK